MEEPIWNERTLYDHHPDPTVTGFPHSFARHTFLYMVMLVIIAVATAIRFG